MTTYKTVVSWLVFLFLAYVVVKRSFQRLWHEVMLQLYYIDADRWGKHIDVVRSYAGVEDILAGLIWTIVALMLVAPWLRALWSRRRKSARTIPQDDPHSSWLNIAGRWICALIYLDHMFGWLPFHPSTFMRPLRPDYPETLDAVNFFAGVFRPFILGTGAAFLIAPELAQLASSGFTSFIDAVFFPGSREAKPPYTLKLARFYVENQRFDEAEAEYARMLSFYPDQPEAWHERLGLAFQRPAPAERAPAEVLAAAFKALSKPSDRDTLHRRFTELTG